MKKYEATIYRSQTSTHSVMANSPHEAIKSILESNSGWLADSVSLIEKDDEEQEVEVESWALHAHCESCGNPILEGDEYYPWEECYTCAKCGGENESHPKLTA